MDAGDTPLEAVEVAHTIERKPQPKSSGQALSTAVGRGVDELGGGRDPMVSKAKTGVSAWCG